MDSLYLTEMFGPTLQGEGILAGTMASFIRTAGCTVGCRDCDTKVSWPFGANPKAKHKLWAVEEIVKHIEAWKARYVVITGGEPMETEHPEALAQLVSLLDAAGKHVTIELSGSVAGIMGSTWLARMINHVQLWSFSPKVASMHPVKPPLAGFIAGVLFMSKDRRVGQSGQLKFVMDPDNWVGAVLDVTALLRDLTDLGCPAVPVLFQTITKPKDTPDDILMRQERLFHATQQLQGQDWGQWRSSDVRITCQTHVLLGLR